MTPTVVILASGPSMTKADAELVRRAGLTTIVINDTFRLLPEADALFAADAIWWMRHPEAAEFRGAKFVSEDQRVEHAQFVPPRPPSYGGNSALRAAHLVSDWKASRILLLGVDLIDEEPTHWHGQHDGEGLINPSPATFARCRSAWAAFSEQYARPDIVNCSRRTALTCFRRMELEQALAEEVEHAV